TAARRTTPTPRRRVTIRAVLDTSAIRAYTAGSIDVGEIIGQLSDEGVQFGLPALCLIDAAIGATARDLAMLNLLTHHTAAALMPLDTDQWQRIAAASSLYGATGRACAVIPVIDHNAEYVITAEPDAYPGVDTIAI
ncbi:MAG: hypothetical protein J2P17_26290, partial [Mycobacterium sp.]|nr:hypothetical protein [Mycobacterium sp.]